MGGDRLRVYRITDFAIPMRIQADPVLANTIHEDGYTVGRIPNIIDEYWIGVEVKGRTFACFRFHQLTSVSWQAHIRVLPKYRRKYSMKAAQKAIEWVSENIRDIRTLVCMIPKCHRDVSLFARRVGFEFCGTIKDSYVKNGLVVGTDIFSMNIEKAEE